MNANNSTTTQPVANIPGPELKEILVAVDLSKSSASTIRQAAQLAIKESAHLTVLNVIKEPPAFRTFDQPFQRLQERQQHALMLRQIALDELGSEEAARLMVCTGEPWREINRVAQQRHASLIVLSQHPQHRFPGWLRSHTANRVVAHAPCPVMVLN